MRVRLVPTSALAGVVVVVLAAGPRRVSRGAPTSARPRRRGPRARSPRRRAVSGHRLRGRLHGSAARSSRRCPPNAPERTALRAKLLHYLLDPVLALNPDTLRREVRDLENDDVYDVVFESFRDALALYDPAELWSAAARGFPRSEQRAAASRRRAGRLRVLAARRRPAGHAGAGGAGDDGSPNRANGAIASIKCAAGRKKPTRSASVAPRKSTSAPSTCSKPRSATGRRPPWSARLDALYVERQQRSAPACAAPGGGESARRALGELLLAHGDEMQRAVVSLAGIYLRAGLIGEAARRTARARRADRRRPRAARPARRRGQARRGRGRLPGAGAPVPAAHRVAGRHGHRHARSARRPARPRGRASRAAPTTPSCWCSRATSRACCRRTSWPSAASKRPSWCSSRRRRRRPARAQSPPS